MKKIKSLVKIDELMPELREEIKKMIDKKVEDVKKKVEEKRQEIQRKLDGISNDGPQSNDGNNLGQKSQKTNNNSLEELKQRIKDRVKSKLSIQTFPFP